MYNKLEDEFLICEALNLSKANLISHPELVESTNPKLLEFKKRKEAKEPLAYIVGYQPFLGLNFLVDKNVLIPRPETELLVEEALKHAKPENKHLSILDVGTGSGVIAVSIANALDKVSITAIDISEGAIAIANKNAQFHNVINKIKFIKSDLFSCIPKGTKFDLIVSNPPYIPSDEIETLQTGIKDFEPRVAIDGGLDGLDIIKRIAGEVCYFLKDNGKLFLEIGFGQAKEIRKILKKNKFKNIKIIKDYAEIERIVMAMI